MQTPTVASASELKSLAAETGGFWYVATPYTKYAQGIAAAFRDACKATAWLIKQGVPAYSPIAHTHPVATYGHIDALDHSIWLPADEPMMRAAVGVLVVDMPGWRESYGVAHEITLFTHDKKPVRLLPWPLPKLS